MNRRSWVLKMAYRPYNQVSMGAKTLETRAINPDEPEKCVEDIKPGDLITLVNRETEGKQVITVTEVRKYLRVADFYLREDLTKVFPGERFTSLDDMLAFYSTISPGYATRLECYGLVVIEFKPVIRQSQSTLSPDAQYILREALMGGIQARYAAKYAYDQGYHDAALEIEKWLSIS